MRKQQQRPRTLRDALGYVPCYAAQGEKDGVAVPCTHRRVPKGRGLCAEHLSTALVAAEANHQRNAANPKRRAKRTLMRERALTSRQFTTVRRRVRKQQRTQLAEYAAKQRAAASVGLLPGATILS